MSSELNLSRIFEEFQGKSLDGSSVELIVSLQNGLLESAISEGLADLASFERGEMVQDNPLYRAFELVHFLNEFVRQPDRAFLLKIASLRFFYQSVHKSFGIESDAQKLFLEFLTGLMRFEVIAQMSEALVAKIVGESVKVIPCEGSVDEQFLLSIRRAEQVSNDIYAQVIGTFESDPEMFWQRIEKAVREDPVFERAAKALAGLHFLPEHSSVVSMAQAIHWQGLGGKGGFLEKFPELAFLQRAAIGYMSGVAGEVAPDRISWFVKILVALKSRGMVALAQSLEALMPYKKELRIFDAGSGDKMAAINGLKTALPEKVLRVTAADMVAESLKSLCVLKDGEKNGNLIIEEVIYQNLLEELEANGRRDTYDVFSAGNVLHQLMDRESGEEKVADVIRFATDIVKEGGLVYLQDVGQAAYLQFPVIPGNLVDREGCLPVNIYERISFADVAVSDRNTYSKYVKIPYRLSKLWQRVPENLEERGGIYEFNIFLVVKLPQEELAKLDELREHGKFEECDVIIQNYYNIGKLQDDILAKVKAGV